MAYAVAENGDAKERPGERIDWRDALAIERVNVPHGKVANGPAGKGLREIRPWRKSGATFDTVDPRL